MTLEKVMKDLNQETEILQMEASFVYVLDKVTLKLKKVWKITEAGTLEQLNLEKIVTRVAMKLKDSVDAEALLKELLIAKTHPAFLMELDERLQKPDVKVTSQPKRCYSLLIGGKVGRPIELCLVNNQGSDL